MTDDDSSADERYLRSVIASYRNYARHSMAVIDSKERQLDRLPARHRQLLCDTVGYRDKLKSIRQCIQQNQLFLHEIVPPVDQEQQRRQENGRINDSPEYYRTVSDERMGKIHSTLRQFVREWSRDGQQERTESFGLICKRLVELLPLSPRAESSESSDTAIRVLVPGAGLGRLAYDIAKLGYDCQGNEFSFEMLLASNMILNRCERPGQFTIHPWLHNFSNHWSSDDQLKAVHIPDCQPRGLSSRFSMVAGEFLEAYAEQSDCWHCIVTCFFIDTAPNPVEYVETIFRLLRPGGYWINLGPLLYHYESMAGRMSVELTLDELLAMAGQIGFKPVTETSANSGVASGATAIDCTYCGNRESMLSYHYRCALFVRQK